MSASPIKSGNVGPEEETVSGHLRVSHTGKVPVQVRVDYILDSGEGPVVAAVDMVRDAQRSITQWASMSQIRKRSGGRSVIR